MENLDTLMGKYGEEGDKLIFKILNNGINNEKNIEKSKAGFEKLLEGKNSSDITERALKYDLTIPFARYVAMNHTKLIFPLRRYQIQPVWRADRPQKGRYREFTQCDVDIVGSKSLLNEVELSNIYDAVFRNLGIEVTIKINNRKILQGIAEYCGCPDKLTLITTALDKIDKIGYNKVKIELIEKGIPSTQIDLIFECLNINENDLTNEMCLDCIGVEKINLNIQEQKIACLKYKFWDMEIVSGMEGCDELLRIFNLVDNIKKIDFDISLARGLNYYTGTIFEVKAPDEVKMGSIGGGGRYDDLTGLFGVPGFPGVGISFGVDRIYDVLEELNLFPADVQSSTKALFFNMGEKESQFAFGIMQQLRSSGIACELYHEAVKINKQFTYAEKKNIPFVIIIGSKEMEQQNCQVKNLSTGEQQVILFEKLPEFFNSH